MSQKDVAIYDLQTIEGYGTIYQKNYYDYFIQLSQVFWDKYSSTLPPISIYKFREIQPIASELSGYNVKYVISPHQIKDKDFILKKNFGNYSVYENKIVKPRAYFGNVKEAPIMEYSPNYIKVDTSTATRNELIVAEVYSPGWIAKLDGEKEVEIKEIHNKLRQVEIEKGKTKFVEMYYNPRSFQIGKIISLTTLLLILLLTIKSFQKKKEPSLPQKAR